MHRCIHDNKLNLETPTVDPLDGPVLERICNGSVVAVRVLGDASDE